MAVVEANTDGSKTVLLPDGSITRFRRRDGVWIVDASFGEPDLIAAREALAAHEATPWNEPEELTLPELLRRRTEMQSQDRKRLDVQETLAVLDREIARCEAALPDDGRCPICARTISHRRMWDSKRSCRKCADAIREKRFVTRIATRGWGWTVAEARAELGLTQATLAEELGVSRSWLARLEAGHLRRINGAMAVRLANYLPLARGPLSAVQAVLRGKKR